MQLSKSDINVSLILNSTISLAKKAGKVVMKHFKNLNKINYKSEIDLVTKADIESEQIIIKHISKKYPNHDIITEEQESCLTKSPYCWVIDPLDGTTNFVHGLPIFAISIALKYNEKTILGVVYNPASGDLYSAEIGNGAYKNGCKINVSLTKTLKRSLLVTGFPYNHNTEWHLCFSLFHELYSLTQGIRRLGAAALDFCFVAEGIFDGFYEINLNTWDIAAGDLIVREAGGSTSGWLGEKLPHAGKRVLATNGMINNEILEVINQDTYKTLIL